MPRAWNNILTVTVDELVPAFFNSEGALKLEISRYQDKEYGIKKVQRGGNGREMLIAFDSLGKEIQNAIGDPRKISNPLELYYKPNGEAVKYYTFFKFTDDTTLSLKHIDEYATNASVLCAAIELKAAREYERKSKGGGTKKVMATVCNDVASFNKVLETKHTCKHSLPACEKRFKEALKDFATPFTDCNGDEWSANYLSLISGRLRNGNRKLVTDDLLNLLNALFAGQGYKPTVTEVHRQYEAFLNEYVEVFNNEDGVLYEPRKYRPISDAQDYEIMTKYIATIEGYINRRAAERINITVTDKRTTTLNNKFVIEELNTYEAANNDVEAAEIVPFIEDETVDVMPSYCESRKLKNRFYPPPTIMIQLTPKQKELIRAALLEQRKNFDGRDEAFAEKYGINYSVFSRLKTGKDIDGLLRDTKWNDLAYELEVDFKADKWVIVKRKCTA